MSLNLNGFGQMGHAHQNQDGLLDTNERAVLFVFNPFHNQFEDIGLRPFNYNFDTNFLNDVQTLADQSRAGYTGGSALLDDLSSRVNLNDYMVPTQSAQMTFGASHLSNHYRFLLILTSTGRDLILPNTAMSNANNNLRRIYSGFFTDEPFNPVTFSDTRRTLNPHAKMVITHKTVVGTTTEHGAWGSTTRVDAHSSDEVFNPEVSLNLTSVNYGGGPGDLHLMTPDACFNEIATSAEGDTLIMPGIHSRLDKWNGADIASSVLEQPEHNINKIVSGIINYQDEMNNRRTMQSRRAQTDFESHFLDEDVDRRRMAKHLQSRRSSLNSQFDLDIGQAISPVDIDKMVSGQLQVKDFDLERPAFYDTADQMESSILNQYSFLIASVVPPILSTAGLNDIEFIFEFGHQQGQVVTNWEIRHAGANYPTTPQELQRMVAAVKYELENGIFRTIFESKGDFVVSVSANATQMTVVRLDLLGMGIRCLADYEFPSCMGGLVSPLLGDSASRNHNSEAIETMYRIATGDTQTAPSYFNEDDRTFSEYANNFKFGD